MDTTERRPTLDNHEWSDLSSSTYRSLVLSNINARSLFVGIHAHTSAVVNWKAIPSISDTMDTTEEQDEPHAHEEGYIQCDNCKAWIPERSRMLHENFCLRNNVLCPYGCGRVFKRGSTDLESHWHCDKCDYVGTRDDISKHDTYFHSTKTCICNNFTTQCYKQLAQHRHTECPEKLITCRYCHVSYS